MKKIILAVTQGECIIAIAPTTQGSSFDLVDPAQAAEWGEAVYQIDEGGSYEFILKEGYLLEEIPGIVTISKLNSQAGRITPNIFVGTLHIKIFDLDSSESIGLLSLEVRSVKATYRDDYRRMLEEIAEKCTDLLLQHSSPVVQSFVPDLEKDSTTVYQRFAFIKSILESDEFASALHKITSSPTTKWKYSLADKPIQSIKRFDRKVLRQVSSSNQRTKLSDEHPLSKSFSSLPSKIQISVKEETVDTPENKFIKFALESFLRLCSDFSHLKGNTRVRKEAAILEDKLESFLNVGLFKDVTALTSIPINNPVLQRKEGYREIYRTWLLFDLAAKLTWQGGEDVYEGNKRDVAVLYEYWLFFKLIELVAEVFEFDLPLAETLLEETSDGFGLKIKQGRFLPIKGVSDKGSRKLHVQLSYNRTYKGDQPYPGAGSWSRNLRPDYTLTIWPFGIDEDQAELEELIVHIHFDAKYKIEKFQEIFSDGVELDLEKEEQRKGSYQRADLLKMHAYRDAIRRTAGAYVLYPGDDQPKIKKGFHELVPGLGAFAIRPTLAENGTDELRVFLNEVLEHFLNRASQREKQAFRVYDIHKKPPEKDDEVRETLPEAFNTNRGLMPDETFVLVGFYRTPEQYEWIKKKQLYNFRTDTKSGSLILDKETVGSTYLLLHTGGDSYSKEIWKINSKGPKIWSKETMIKKGYPNPEGFYLIIEIEPVTDLELQNAKWQFKKFINYKKEKPAHSFTATLSELVKNKLK